MLFVLTEKPGTEAVSMAKGILIDSGKNKKAENPATT